MSDGGNTPESACPCGTVEHPLVIANPPGRAAIAYRSGDYASFRHAMLLPLPGETQLTRTDGDRVSQIWRPGAEGDLAVQMVEWWAYLSDVLTFYNERAANQAYLATADLPESVNRLVVLLGYRPRPGIGATGRLAALTTGPDPVTLPAGFQVQSKPGLGQPPQVFELGKDVTFTPSLTAANASAGQGSVPAAPVPAPSPLVNAVAPDQGVIGSSGGALIRGVVGSIRVGDELLLLSSQWRGPDRNYALVQVTGISPEKDPVGNTNTRILYTITAAGSGFAADALAANYRLLRSGQVARLYPYVTPSTIASGRDVVDLESISRQIRVGDPILFEDPRPAPTNAAQLVGVTSYTEVIYYADNPANPSQPSSTAGYPYSGPAPPPSIPIPHTQLTIEPSLDSPWDARVAQVLYAWKDVGTLIDTPVAAIGGQVAVAADRPPLTLQLDSGDAIPRSVVDVLVQDANGKGGPGILSGSTVQLADAGFPLVAPFRVLFNLLSVTCGKSVDNEVLGGGNALVAGQDFTLQKSPVTYLQDPGSLSGDNYSSTVRVRVNQLEWSEVRSFYEQGANAQVFMTREDEQGQTHVVFGDGEDGARLPTGVNNIEASYRYGSGAAVPVAGSLTVVLQPRPGLRSILNPVPVGGGADPDPPAKVRQLAPRSVLTLGRAISIDDFQAIALQAPGVTRAMAALAFSPLTQRPEVRVWVGDDPGAVAAAVAAFAASADPNRQPAVVQAAPVKIRLCLTVTYDPRRLPQVVHNAVAAALIDPDRGLFGLNAVAIGQVFHDSEIYAACLRVPGVLAVHSLRLSPAAEIVPASGPAATGDAGVVAQSRAARRTSPPAYPRTAPSAPGGERHDPGAGSYFVLPEDGQHLDIVMELSS